MFPNLMVPKWVRAHWFTFKSEAEIPAKLYDSIRHKVENIMSEDPLVSIGIIAYNEEQYILRTISSLAEQRSSFPMEIICTDNNSTDKTGEIVRKTGIKYVLETKKGVGNARQAAMDKAKGKYYLTVDADTIYPPYWVECMVRKLQEPGVAAVYGRASFYKENLKKLRIGFAVYEFVKYLVHDLRGIKRPELSVCGYNFGMVKELAYKTGGWNVIIKRGEDGYMAWQLTKFGKVVPVRSKKSIVWMIDRSLKREGSFISAIGIRIFKEFKRVNEYFSKQKGNYETLDSNKY
jgi:glycosyltransferase involved in cell wall biosynthesis